MKILNLVYPERNLMRKLLTILLAAITLGSCQSPKYLGTTVDAFKAADENNWSYMGSDSNNCYWFVDEQNQWDIAFCTENSMIYDVEYYLPNDQALIFYLYLDIVEEYKCDGDSCWNRDTYYKFIPTQTETVIIQHLK